MTQTEFVQAGIKVQQQQEFEQLRAAIERVFSSSSVKPFFKRLKSSGLRVRQFEAILAAKLFDQVDSALVASGATAEKLYQVLPASDQGQIREFYLTRVEQVDPALREKFYRQYETY
jgi:hypothetical protein